MADLQAGDLVKRLRQLLQIFGDAEAYRDGYAAEVDTAPTPLLSSIHDMQALLQPTGVRVSTVTTATVIGTAQYSLGNAIGEEYSVTYAGIPLMRSSRQGKDTRSYNWRNAATGTPTEYIREGQSITLLPTPSAVGSLVTTGTFPLATYTIATDTVQYVPEYLQRYIPYGAARITASIDAENPVHIRRINEYGAHALFLIKELARISRPADFGDKISLDHWVANPQFGVDMNLGLQRSYMDIFGPISMGMTPRGADQ